VEYAQKAIDSGGTSIGVKCKDGVVLANEKLLFSKMLVDSSNRAHFGLDLHCGMVTSGILPDGRQLALRARSVAKQFKGAYALPIIPQQLADQMGQFIHAYTCYYQFRPFGASFIFAGYDATNKEAELYGVDSAGNALRYFGHSVGKGARAAKTEIERMKFSDKTCREALKDLAKIIEIVHDDVKDKPYLLEMSWVCEETGMKWAMVKPEDALAARKAAMDEIAAEDEESDEDDSDDDDDEDDSDDDEDEE
jgi:20S proteasome subunit alpha 7